MRKELELANAQIENLEATFRRKHQTALAEMSSEIDNLSRAKGKAEKEKNTYLVEIDNIASQLDSALKSKVSFFSDVSPQVRP